MYTYQESIKSSEKYFNDNKLAAKVVCDKYLVRDNQENMLELNPDDMHHRLAKEFARIEKVKFKNPLLEEEIYKLLKNFSCIIPQGSPMAGIGNNEQLVSLSNCYVLETPEDSYGSILKTDQQLVQIAKRRGGNGIDISQLRPEGVSTNNSSRTSSGILSFLERYSNSTREVGQGGRRGALMVSLDIHHPQSVKLSSEPYTDVVVNPNMEHHDIYPINTTTEWYDPNNLDFSSIKYDRTKVTGANISLKLTDEFMTAATSNKDFEQRWPKNKPTVKKIINAKKAWDKIITAAWQTAEPGLLFWDNIIKESPAGCYKGFEEQSTNPCSELPLPSYDSCRLLIQNLFYFIDNPFTKSSKFRWADFFEKTKIAQRLMDDLIDLELEKIDTIINKIKNDPENNFTKQFELDLWENIRIKCNDGRRTGLGLTALADTMAALGIKYGTKKSINFTEKVYRFQKFAAYTSSVEIAEELGSFSVWDHKCEKNNPFLNRFKDETIEIDDIVISGLDLYNRMKKSGRRNISLLTSAPTGSTSMVAQIMDLFGTTSGIEPVYFYKYTRRKKGNPNDKDFRSDFFDGKDHWMEFNVYHAGYELWKRLNPDIPEEESPYYKACANDIDWTNRVKLQAAAQIHIDHSISSTINLPNDVSKDEVANIYETAWKMGLKGITVYREGSRSGVIIQKTDKVSKRPDSVACEVYHISVKQQPYFILLGIVNGKPWEIFAGKNGILDQKIKHGQIVKMKRPKQYKFIGEDGTEICPLSAVCGSDEEQAVTRLTSLALQNNTPIEKIVSQLEKSDGSLFGFAKALIRALKKYLKDGSNSGDLCEDCQTQLIYENGCKICKNCGWSKC